MHISSLWTKWNSLYCFRGSQVYMQTAQMNTKAPFDTSSAEGAMLALQLLLAAQLLASVVPPIEQELAS